MLLFTENSQTAILENGMKKEKYFLAFALAACFVFVVTEEK
jgi:hypothetical protein